MGHIATSDPGLPASWWEGLRNGGPVLSDQQRRDLYASNWRDARNNALSLWRSRHWDEAHNANHALRYDQCGAGFRHLCWAQAYRSLRDQCLSAERFTGQGAALAELAEQAEQDLAAAGVRADYSPTDPPSGVDCGTIPGYREWGQRLRDALAA